jgi:valyl-tRNA synthetase
VTEELWDNLRPLLKNTREHVTVCPWPASDPTRVDDELEEAMRQVFDVISAIRSVRSEMKIPAARKIDCVIRADRTSLLRHLKTYADNVRILGRIENLTIDKTVEKPIPSASAVIRDAEIFIPLEGVVDLAAERKRLERDLDHHSVQLEKINRKLSNDDFLANAPADVVERERAKRENFEKIVARIQTNLEQLVGW